VKALEEILIMIFKQQILIEHKKSLKKVLLRVKVDFLKHQCEGMSNSLPPI
jgi:hypothetical protein